jgi:hypothetical protein
MHTFIYGVGTLTLAVVLLMVGYQLYICLFWAVSDVKKAWKHRKKDAPKLKLLKALALIFWGEVCDGFNRTLTGSKRVN